MLRQEETRYTQQAMTATAFSYYPFPVNWHAESRWRREIYRNPSAVRLSLQGYQRVLTKESIFTQDWTHHPLAFEYWHVSGRWRMLETGYVLRFLRKLGDYPRRLLNRKDYLQACAELRAMLLLRWMGFKTWREPSNRNAPAQSRPKGPDLLAIRGHGRCGVEVKCPTESDSARGRTQLVSHIVFRTQELLPDKQVNIALNPEAVANGVVGSWPNKRLADDLLLEALAESELTGASCTVLGRVAPAPPGFSSMIGPIPDDEKHEAERLRALLEGAATQLRAWAPGIVILDSSADPSIMRRCCDIAALMSEDWAEGLGCVLLVASTYPGFVVTVVPGRRWRALPSLRGRICSKGHIHIPTFDNRTICTVDEQFDEFPAFCEPGVGHLPARILQ